MSKRLTTQEFIEKAKAVHGDSYDYSLVEYKTCKEKVTIRCRRHGNFKQSPEKHYNSQGCPKCGNDKCGDIHRKDIAYFLKKSFNTHGDMYSYSNVEYVGCKDKVIITCAIHGDFKQRPQNHWRGDGCPKCGDATMADKRRKGTVAFIERSHNVHGKIYDYSQVDYINNSTSVIIGCSRHGYFKQAPSNHYAGQGCPLCKSSEGEKRIVKFLKDNGVTHDTQKRFPECRDKKPLPFDAEILIDENKSILVEYQGIQHYFTANTNFFGGKEALLERQKRDEIKRQFCYKNGIDLLEIPYWHKPDIEKILMAELTNQ